ncbi:wax ester/triacylglycerol synthase family O-acyltransferase, partial [bacterium]|nr:wax ester/triacylglycerol synthase family O-acyltransferase [bacterium]
MDQEQHFLGPVDTAFLHVESEESPMNIGAVSLFDGHISYEQLVQLIDSRIYQAPIYQKRLLQDPMQLGPVKWVYDPDFHVRRHVFQRDLPAPGDDDALRSLVGELLSDTLNRAKPLWEMYLINGLQGDRSAIFFKLHHCMVDGLEAVELFALMLDFTPEIQPMRRKPLYDAPYLPTKSEQLIDGLREDLPHKVSILNKLRHDFEKVGALMTDKERRRRAFVGAANLLNDNLGLIHKLPINGQNTGQQALAWAEFSLAEVRAIKATRKASVNDVMLTVLAAGLGRYAQAQRVDFNAQPFLRVLIPVSMRDDDDKGKFGNRISVLPIDVPLVTSDPMERLEATAHYTTTMKDSSLSIGLDIILTLPSLMPVGLQPFVWKLAPVAFSVLAHTWCTNVAGPQIPLYLLGNQLLGSYGFFPLNPSMGLACVVTSYNQRIAMTLVADKGIVPDVEVVARYLEEAYIELREAAKVTPREPVMLEQTRTTD